MKKISKWLTVAIIPLLCFSLSSCGGDDNNDEPDFDNGNSNNPSTEKMSPLVGFWVQNTDRIPQYFLFLADGTCRHSFDGYGAVDEHGHWIYDETTKLLTTDCSGYMWEVSLITDESWAGYGLKYKNSDSYSRLSDASAFRELMDFGSFTNEHTQLSYQSSSPRFWSLTRDGVEISNSFKEDMLLGNSDKEGWDFKLYHIQSKKEWTIIDIRVKNLYAGRSKTTIEILWPDGEIETLK